MNGDMSLLPCPSTSINHLQAARTPIPLPQQEYQSVSDHTHNYRTEQQQQRHQHRRRSQVAKNQTRYRKSKPAKPALPSNSSNAGVTPEQKGILVIDKKKKWLRR